MRRSFVVLGFLGIIICGCTGGDTRPPPDISDSVSELEQTTERVNRFRETLKTNLSSYQSSMAQLTEFRGLRSENFPLSSFKHTLVSCFNQSNSDDIDPDLASAAKRAGVTCSVVALPGLLDALEGSPDRQRALDYVGAIDVLRLSRISVQTDIREIDRVVNATLQYVASRRRESTRYAQQLDRDRDLYSSGDYSAAIKRVSSFRDELKTLETLARTLRDEQESLSEDLTSTTRIFYDRVVPFQATP